MLRLAIDVKLFDAVVALSSEHRENVRVESLCERVDADPLFVGECL